MTKYVVNRLLRGFLSVAIMVVIVMVMIFTLMDRQLIFASDPLFSKKTFNAKETYMYSKWEEYGYLDYVTYADYLLQLPRTAPSPRKPGQMPSSWGAPRTKTPS